MPNHFINKSPRWSRDTWFSEKVYNFRIMRCHYKSIERREGDMNIQKCKSNDERNFIANITYLRRLFELIQLNESRILQRNDDVFFLSSTRRIFLSVSIVFLSVSIVFFCLNCKEHWGVNKKPEGNLLILSSIEKRKEKLENFSEKYMEKICLLSV